MLQHRLGHLPDWAESLLPEDDDSREHIPETALATWWTQPTGGTLYWRCLLPAKHLPGRALKLGYADTDVDDKGVFMLRRQRGPGIWQYVGNAQRALMMAHSQDYHGLKALMEVDDNYLRPPPHVANLRGAPGLNREVRRANGLAIHIKGAWHHKLDRTSMDRYSFQAHRKIIRWVDGVIVSTDELAEQYAKATDAPIYVCPNSADLDDWPAIEQKDGNRNIGYAGSASHVHDVGLVEDALDWASRQPGCIVWKLGVTEKDWPFRHIKVPWTNDLHQYRRNLQSLSVGLCPLIRSPWSDGKSDVKAIEYTLAGAVPIVQKAPPYKDWFDVVPTCETEKDWLKAVKWACKAPREELDEVWQRAHAFVMEQKLIGQHIHRWREAIA